MTDTTSDWYRPARGYSRPPFEAGNEAAVRHGANSERLVSERADELLGELVVDYPWLSTADSVTLDVLLRSKVRHDALSDYVDGVLDGSIQAYPRKGFPSTGIEAVPQRVFEQLSREARTVVDCCAKLGFTATDRARLLRDAGQAASFIPRVDHLRLLARMGQLTLLARNEQDPEKAAEYKRRREALERHDPEALEVEGIPLANGRDAQSPRRGRRGMLS